VSQPKADRVRITSPRMGATRRGPGRPIVREIDEQTRLGEVYLGALLRSQLWLSLRVLGVLLGTLGALPLLFTLVPSSRDARLLGVPVPWLLLGLAAYPFFLLTARWYIRQAEEREREFAELGPEPPHPPHPPHPPDQPDQP
jgi:hypothetical protein